VTVAELMHRLAGLPPETQVRLPVTTFASGTRLLSLAHVHTIKMRVGNHLRFPVCVLSGPGADITRAAEREQQAIDAAERKKTNNA
jgi:hypothetical protein